jgi:hypothetical protein
LERYSGHLAALAVLLNVTAEIEERVVVGPPPEAVST